MEKYYFTFGFGQLLENHFIIIRANSHSEAREIMVKQFGSCWAFQYTEQQWNLPNGKTQSEEYNLIEIK